MKINPVTMVTESPNVPNQFTPVTEASQLPISPSLSSSMTMINAPTIGPNSVPRPPTSVISTTRPDMLQCASVSVSKPSTMAFIAPARPDNAADNTNATIL